MQWVQPFIDWVAANPGPSLAVLFVICFADALLVIGFLVPSYIILFSIGALIALDTIALWPVVLASSAGALLGDLFNYWLGRRWLERWIHHPRMARFGDSIEQGRNFLGRHGGPGLILGRLFGVIRPVVPMVAGAARMPLRQFLPWVTVSSVIWALVFVIPGVAVGASLSLAAEVTARLAALLLAAILLVLVLVWLSRLMARLGSLYAGSLLDGLLDWSRRHRQLGRLSRWLTDPDQPETPALLIFALLLLASGWLWLLLVWGLDRTTPLAIDALVYRSLAELHSHWGLAGAAWIAHIGDAPVMVAVGTAIVITLVGLRRFRAVAHSVAALAFGGIIALGLSLGVRVPDPIDFYAGHRVGAYSGVDLAFATMVIGLLPILLATRRRHRDTTPYYTRAVVLVGLITAAQLYLGRQWFSVAAVSIVIGVLWMAVLAAGYRRHGAQLISAPLFLAPVLLTMVAATTTVPPPQLPDARQAVVMTLDAQAWWRHDYRLLPTHRDDGSGRERQPIGLQWNTDEAALFAALDAGGWQPAERLNWRTALRYLAPSSPIEELPIPTQQMLMRAPLTVRYQRVDAHRLRVLRLWRSDWETAHGPIWLGSLTYMETRRPLGLMQLPRTLDDYSGPLDALRAPPGVELRRVEHPGRDAAPDGWQGQVWLLRPQTTPPAAPGAPMEHDDD